MADAISKKALLVSLTMQEQAELSRPQLLSLRMAAYEEHLAGMTVPSNLRKWQGMMSSMYGPRVRVWEQTCEWLVALLIVRYGEAIEYWPEAFTADDELRARIWMQGKIPKGVLHLGPQVTASMSFGLALIVVGAVLYALAILENSAWGMWVWVPVLGSAMTDWMEQQMATHLLRTGVTTLNAWANATAYTAGDLVRAGTWNNRIFQCVVGGTSGGSEPTWNTTIGAETTDNTVTWIACAVGLPKRPLFWALYTAAPGETGGGTEVTGGSYGRAALHPADANWAAAGSNGLSDNAAAITFPTPTANWGVISHFGAHYRSTGDTLMVYGALAQSKTVNNGDPAPSFPVGALDLTFA